MSIDPTTAFYDRHAKEYWTKTVDADVSYQRERFLKYLASNSHILDAGCGSGRDTRVFLARGFEVTAIDASPRLARLAAEFTGQPCKVLRFQEMAFSEAFDGIWACASLLHVPACEMPDVLARLARALKVEGVLYVSVKEGEGEQLSADGRYFRYYSPHSFRSLLSPMSSLEEVAFWRNEEIRSTNHREPWLSFIFKKRAQAEQQVTGAEKKAGSSANLVR